MRKYIKITSEKELNLFYKNLEISGEDFTWRTGLKPRERNFKKLREFAYGENFYILISNKKLSIATLISDYISNGYTEYKLRNTNVTVY